jgi:ABC-type uncharacterized transport system ATPase subunit
MHLDRSTDAANIVLHIVADERRKLNLGDDLPALSTQSKRKLWMTHIVEDKPTTGLQHAVDLLENMVLSRLRQQIDHTVRQDAINRVGFDGEGVRQGALNEANVRREQAASRCVCSSSLDHILIKSSHLQTNFWTE